MFVVLFKRIVFILSFETANLRSFAYSNDFANVGTIFDGINTYTFDAKKLDNQTVELFDTKSENIDKLKDELYNVYRNRRITANDLFDQHQKTGLYCRSHYTEAFTLIELFKNFE